MNAGPSLEHEVCFHYGHNKASWFSTYEEQKQHWPMDTSKHVGRGKSFTTADFFHYDFGGIIEHLFINSDGFAVMLNEHHPWFLRRDSNNGDPIFCVSVSHDDPYPKLNKYPSGYFDIQFTVKVGKNIRDVTKSFTDPNSKSNAKLAHPTHLPDERVIRYPIWSTWAEYKKNINEHKVLDFATQIKKHGFPNSQIEIDDFWEHKYGDFSFDHNKFPDPKKLISELHGLGFRVTAWVYPFVNHDSVAYEANKNHFIKDANGHPLKVDWWDGSGGAVDFSDVHSAKWFVDRLEKLKKDTGLDAYKFDAGELNWYGKKFHVKDPQVQLFPNLMTQRYVQTCSNLGGMIEVRTAYKSQQLPIYVRMLDKGSRWSIDNGLQTLVTTSLMMSLAGYHFNLPDMIGGNAYGPKPDEELYIRWVQANAFLPSLQFSIPPWAYKASTVNITKKFVDLHVEHADTIIQLAKEAISHGTPIIRPMWYAEPDDHRTFKIGDQYMLGEDIVVAPVLEKGQVERQVYLPSGTWLDASGKSFTGPAEIKVSAPLEVLPWFKRKH
ncbi:PREDICTED: uncharacterized family 31 glucosidase KIAA1161-like [Rhagoletis zephyria]|uniref:uncharacterized family 31 glucosidase KIAA1161-like n=1 Tax=Rhagoletis zephyria TaxID=28612 RepID=UPI0008114012|nr:PREDICTED: uncharacterized family 31 glucosidase KIAA1161-like [Rhagoletis zephyria]